MNNDQLKVAIEALHTSLTDELLKDLEFAVALAGRTYPERAEAISRRLAEYRAAIEGASAKRAYGVFNEQWECEQIDAFNKWILTARQGINGLSAMAGWMACARASLAKVERDTTYKGWYCSHCQRGVDSSEVTFHEQHTVCGRVISDDVPPVAVKVEREPEVNSDMMNAGADAMREGMCMLNSGRSYQSVCKKIFEAMLAAAPQAQQEAGKDAELRLMLQELCKYHPNTLRTLFCDGKPTGKRIVDLVKARVWIGRPLDGNGPTMTVHSPDDAQNLKAMGYSVHGPYSEASPAQAEAHPCKDECQEAKRIGDPQYGCGSDCCMEPFPQADTQQSNPGWQRITKPGQVNVGDKLRFTIGDDKYNETAKVILYPGTDKEEIIYNTRKNYYLITSMAIENKGSQKNVECFAQQSKKGEGE
ncbi:MAG TPA: hypothetical protein VJ654_14600 [Noviherbaspirillum sp.]|nr:hypothetical protein [Noviherbaspirillum sp.]